MAEFASVAIFVALLTLDSVHYRIDESSTYFQKGVLPEYDFIVGESIGNCASLSIQNKLVLLVDFIDLILLLRLFL